MRVGYACVSDDKAEPDALRAAGCERIFEEPLGSADGEQPVLGQALSALRPGDELVVLELSRVGRSLSHLVDVIARLRERGCGFRSLDENVEAKASGGAVTDLFAALDRFEQKRGRAAGGGPPAARPRGRAGGRKPLAPAKVEAMRALWVQGTMTAAEIAARLEVGRRTVFKYVAGSEARR